MPAEATTRTPAVAHPMPRSPMTARMPTTRPDPRCGGRLSEGCMPVSPRTAGRGCPPRPAAPVTASLLDAVAAVDPDRDARRAVTHTDDFPVHLPEGADARGKVQLLSRARDHGL